MERFVKTWFRKSPDCLRWGLLGWVLPMVFLPLWVGPAGGATPAKENLLMVRINGKAVGDNEPVLEWEPGRLFIPAGVLRKGRLRLPAVRPTHVAALGLDYYPIDAVAGARYTIDSSTQTIDIAVPASSFVDTTLDGLNNPMLTPTRSDPGIFINHDFQLFQGGGQRLLSGLIEGGFFSRFGVFTTQFSGSDLTNHVKPLRLNTQFFRDFPVAMTNLTIGDSVSAVSPWARSVYYAGVRYASNFATQPGFVPTVMPGVSGQATQPSTVDVYIDNVKRLSQPIEAGPFSISNVPVLSDQGQIRMVVTDILGRQQVITESYIRSSQLLRKGVNDFTYESGTLRLNYGTVSDDYRSFFAAATHRRGITEALTLEGRLELQPHGETAGIGAIYALRRVGIVSAGVAGSVARGYRSSGLYYAQFSRQQRSFGIAARLQRAAQDFRQVGLLDQQLATRTLLQGQVSKSFGSRTTVTAGYLRRDGRTELSARVLTSTVGVRLGRTYLSVGGTYSLLGARPYGLNVALVRSLGERTIAMASGGASPELQTASVEVNRSIPLGPGYGYRVRSSNLDQESNDAGFYYQTSQGYYGIEAAQQNNQTSWRYIERGSLVLMHKQIMVSRWLNDSFGLVEVPGEKGVPVYVNHQLLAKTDWRGLALLPWLVAYNRNSVNLDDSKLPSEVSVDLEERTVVPMARSAVFLQYKPATIGGATLLLVTSSGTPVLRGAIVKVNGRPDEYEVALRGEVFVTDIAYPAVIHAEWENQGCEARIDRAPLDNVVPRIGPLVCKAGK